MRRSAPPWGKRHFLPLHTRHFIAAQRQKPRRRETDKPRASALKGQLYQLVSFAMSHPFSVFIGVGTAGPLSFGDRLSKIKPFRLVFVIYMYHRNELFLSLRCVRKKVLVFGRNSRKHGTFAFMGSCYWWQKLLLYQRLWHKAVVVNRLIYFLRIWVFFCANVFIAS